MMKPNVFTEKHRVTYYETDLNGRMRVPVLLNLLLLVSGDQSDQLKIGASVMHSLGLGWVVIQYLIHVNRLPKTNEVVRLSTCSTAYNQLFANRKFKVTDSCGRVEVTVDSTWIALNLTTRRLTSLKPALVRPYGGRRVAMLPHLKRPRPIRSVAGVVQRSYRVRYRDIDANRHVNNSCYLDWMLDLLSPQFLTAYLPGLIDLRFRQEVHYGTVVHSRLKSVRSGQRILTKHEVTSRHQLNAVANVKWRKNRD